MCNNDPPPRRDSSKGNDTMEIEAFRRFAEIDAQIKAHERDIKALKDEKNSLQETLLEEMSEDGVPSLKVDVGGTAVTVYQKRMVVARNLQGPDATAQAVASIPAIAHMAALRVNSQTLSAYVRELVKADEPLPPEFDGIIEPYEKFSVEVRKA